MLTEIDEFEDCDVVNVVNKDGGQAKMVQASEWKPCGEFIYSQYGTVTYFEWCNFEKLRIERQPGRIVKVYKRTRGYMKECCFFVDWR